jgi:peptidoglycan/xylan/chitin deacetylase (PgdA/CDA1 family)
MYHELELPDRPLCDRDRGYVRYVVPAASFQIQMEWLKSQGLRGMSVGEWLTAPENSGIVLTFDDGCETDLLVAAEALRDFGFGATFYLASRFLGRPGYLSFDQAKELCRGGFEIGCHSRTHAYLPTLDSQRMHEEIVLAKAELEELLGRSVEHFSCPGGRWSPKVARIAQEAGYASVVTSRIGVNARSDNPYRLARIALQRGVTLSQFQRVCYSKGLLARRSVDFFMDRAKVLLGDSLYERVRSIALRQV